MLRCTSHFLNPLDLVDDGDGDAVLLGDARDELVVRGSLLLVDDAEEVLDVPLHKPSRYISPDGNV